MKKQITLDNHAFEPLISHQKIVERISEMAREMDRDFEGERPLFLVVLKGAFMFASHLVQAMKTDVDLEFIRIKSYTGTDRSRLINCSMEQKLEVNNRTVVIIEDIVDTGHTVHYLENELKTLGVKTVKVVTLFFKPKKYEKTLKIDYVGHKIPSEFVVGFGLDYDEMGRGLKDLYVET